MLGSWMDARDTAKGDGFPFERVSTCGMGAFVKGGIGSVLPSVAMRRPLLAWTEPPLHVAVVVPLNIGPAQMSTEASPLPRSGVRTSPTPLVRFQSNEYPARITVWRLPKIRFVKGICQAAATRGPRSLHEVFAELLRPGIWRMGLKPNVEAEGEVKPLAKNPPLFRDRKSTRLNSSHGYISYAVFCLKKKKNRSTRKIYHH